jgi:hypothetical protein
MHEAKIKGSRTLVGESAVLTITSELLRAVETLSSEAIASIFIRNIVYTSVGFVAKKELFCFISSDDRLNRWTCHIFDMPSGQPKKCCEV